MLKKMELKEGVAVFTTEGKQVGKINRFVLDPVTKQVTHIVVQKGWLFPEDKVVPMSLVSSATEERVEVAENVGDFMQLPTFEEEHFIRVTDEEDTNRLEHSVYTVFPAYYPYPPLGTGNYGSYPAPNLDAYVWPAVETTRNIPDETVALKEGSQVISSDDQHVGVIERLFIDPDTNKATHFVIKHGLLLKERKVIPVQWVQSVQENKVHILLSSKLLARVRNYEPQMS